MVITAPSDMLTDSMVVVAKQSCSLPNRKKLLEELQYLEDMMVGEAGCLFCNDFLREMIQLLINAISLYESGYFDCAFYSIRQASEVGNNMLYLANNPKSKLEIWNKKGDWKSNGNILYELARVAEFYSQIKGTCPEFFKYHKELIQKAHKIIHKQGFDTFYYQRDYLSHVGEFNKETESKDFVALLENTICVAIVLHIVTDPISLVVADEELYMRVPFEPLTTPAHVEFLASHSPQPNIIKDIQSTQYFSDIVKYFYGQEVLSPATHNVIHHHSFDVDDLLEIELQKHLIPMDAQLILDLLLAGLQFVQVYPECIMYGYTTSISSNYYNINWNSSEYKLYAELPETFNIEYHGVYRSVVQCGAKNWILEHNEVLDSESIGIIQEIFKEYSINY